MRDVLQKHSYFQKIHGLIKKRVSYIVSRPIYAQVLHIEYIILCEQIIVRKQDAPKNVGDCVCANKYQKMRVSLESQIE